MADSLVKTARKRYLEADAADKAQREREREDLKFFAGEQWPDDVRTARAGQNASNGLPPVPARPCLTINKVREPVRAVLNQERQSDIGIELVPADDFGDLGLTPDDTEVKLREGIVRRIQRESEAADARTWAFARAVEAGRGYYMVMTRYLPGKTFDQEVFVQRIYNQNAVRLDPSHEQADASDAEWGFIGAWMSWDEYKAQFPSTKATFNRISSELTGDSEFKSLSEDEPMWIDATADTRAVYVVDYWYTERETTKLALLPDGQVVEAKDVPEGVKPLDTREMVTKRVKWAKLDGINDKPLEETDWPGKYIPLIKVMGEELQPYDRERRAEGMVRPARDAQEGFNAMVSRQVESVALTPLEAAKVDPAAIEGYEEWYKIAATRTLPFLPYRTYDAEGRQLMPPTRTGLEPNIAPIAQSIGMFHEAIISTTGGAAPNRLGVGQSVQSAKAIRSLQEETNFATSNYLDNLARAIRHEGRIINDLLFPIYGRPGRLVRLMNGQGEAQLGMVAGGQPPSDPRMAGLSSKAQTVGTLTEDANFNVIVKVTKAFASRREQEVSIIADLLSANPQLMAWFGDLFFKNQDGPGHMEMAERAKVMLAPQIQEMLAEKEQGQQPLPPQVKAQIQQMQQQLQVMAKMLHDAQPEQVKAQTQLAIAKGDAARDIDIEKMRHAFELKKLEMENAAKIEVARINAETKGIVSAMTAQEEALALGAQQMHEAAESEADRQHERELAVAQMAHGAAMADGQADRASQEAEAQRQAEAEQESQT